MILQRRSESLFVGLPCLWHFEGGRNRWAWIWLAYGWAVRAATVLYMRTSFIIQSDPLEALRTSYDSPIARRSCSKSHCWYNAVYSVYGRRVHACKIQGHTQSLCGRYARVCAGWMMARLHRHPQSRNDYAHGERYVITIYRRRPAREVQANDCTGCTQRA